MKSEHIIIGALLVVIIGFGIMFVLKEVYVQAYQQGVQDANIVINNQVFNSLQSQGFVQFTFIINNQSQTINLVPYVE